MAPFSVRGWEAHGARLQGPLCSWLRGLGEGHGFPPICRMVSMPYFRPRPFFFVPFLPFLPFPLPLPANPSNVDHYGTVKLCVQNSFFKRLHDVLWCILWFETKNKNIARNPCPCLCPFLWCAAGRPEVNPYLISKHEFLKFAAEFQNKMNYLWFQMTVF